MINENERLFSHSARRNGKRHTKSVLFMSFSEILELYKTHTGKKTLTEAEENIIFVNWLRFHFGLKPMKYSRRN